MEQIEAMKRSLEELRSYRESFIVRTPDTYMISGSILAIAAHDASAGEMVQVFLNSDGRNVMDEEPKGEKYVY